MYGDKHITLYRHICIFLTTRQKNAAKYPNLAAPRVFALHSWSDFGREAEYVIAFYTKSLGWVVELSGASRGPADIVATCSGAKWFIEVKASWGIPRLGGYEIRRLKKFSASKNGLGVVSTLQPFPTGFSIGNYSILFYSIDSWQVLILSNFRREITSFRNIQLASKNEVFEFIIVFPA